MSSDVIPLTPLSDKEQTVLAFVEQRYLLQGGMPSFETIAGSTLVDRDEIAKMFRNPAFLEGLDDRGLIYEGKRSSLTPTQLAVANALLDYTDRRSDSKKLRDYGVSTTQYQAWLRDPVFQNYLQERAESLLGDTKHEAFGALLHNVRTGDLGSIKLYLELTGRWSSKTVGEVNIEFLVMKILEIIQRNVTDPDTLMRIGAELEGLIPKPQVAPVQTQPVTKPSISIGL